MSGIISRPGSYLTTLDKSLPNFRLFPDLKDKRKNCQSRPPSLPEVIEFTVWREFTHLLGDQFSKYVHDKANQSRTYAERLDHLRKKMKAELISRLKWPAKKTGMKDITVLMNRVGRGFISIS